VSHLGHRVAAVVDGELGHEARDKALAHVAHCSECRAELASQRAVKELLVSAPAPEPSPALVEALLALESPGGPLPPRARTMPQGPVVPDLPPPGRSPRGARADSRRPGNRGRRRARVLTAGALSAAGLVLATAFVAGGGAPSEGRVVPPVAELSVEHSRTSTAVTVGDPGTGLMSTVGDLPTTTPRR
jgi:anti-sigma factor RsiW